MTGKTFPLLTEQAAAADPVERVWLNASAGTGKTQVLTARVLRLLLSGAAPESLLCITFTKAGAAEMARRVQERLAEWVRLDDGSLRMELRAIHADWGDPATVARARTLFARVIDAPGGGIRIQTIHSFAQTLLASFPLEAGLMPGFEPLDDGGAEALRREVLNALLLSYEEQGNRRRLDAAANLSLRLGEQKAVAFLASCSDLAAKPVEVSRAWVRDALDLPDGPVEDWLVAAAADRGIDPDLDALIAAADDWGRATAMTARAAWAAYRGGDATARAAALPVLLDTLVVKTSGELRAHLTKDNQMGAARDAAVRVVERVRAWIETAAAMRLADEMADIWALGADYAAEYARAKVERGVVDFDDLIRYTVQLLHGAPMADWIRYKLDQRIDHILVDEAQDTNQRQWAIIGGLTEEFFSGEGAKDGATRTLFTVGDRKQAIFGFQGTDPAAFEAARQRFAMAGKASGGPFSQISLKDNFRSSSAILDVVDAWLRRMGPEALGIDAAIPRHVSARGGPGRVELWRALSAQPDDADDAPDDEAEDGAEGDTGDDSAAGTIATDSASRRLANAIARQVRHWIDHGCEGEAVAPGDVLILVRARRDLAALLAARLSAAGVPTAGVDRFELTMPLAVQDLLAAARFAQQPLDDLNLGALLVSPLIGWSHDELAVVASERPSRSHLWPAVRQLDDARLDSLRALLNMADYVTPYRFFETILSGPMAGRQRLVARLGTEALDPIEEFLNQVLAFEGRNTPTMAGFLAWLDSGAIEIKRSSDARGVARVMTVHGSKGLQAPYVILADATNRLQGDDRGFPLELADGSRLPVPRLAKAERTGRIAEAHAAAQQAGTEEAWRLLYVAITRAERMLVVTGHEARRGSPIPDPSWYAAVDATLDDLGCAWEAGPEPFGERRAFRVGKGGKATRTPRAKPAVARTRDVPAWVDAAPPAEARPARPLTPSAPDEDATPLPPPGPGMRAAAERGRLMHALFERLPAVAADRRADVAQRWLGVQGLDGADAARLAAAGIALIDHPVAAEAFAPEARAEVPLAALVDGVVVSGIVDRLHITDDRVTVLDFKTGSRVPDGIAAIPAAHVRQMAAYAAALRVIFPGREVAAGLLYTSGPVLWMVPDDMLMAARPDGAVPTPP